MLHAAWYLARLYEISYVKRVERNKNSHNTVDLRHLSLMSKGLKVHAAWYLARLYEISYVKRVKRNKNSHNTIDLRHLSLMSKESKVHSIYNVDSNSKYLN